jgi:hypothetical protein
MRLIINSQNLSHNYKKAVLQKSISRCFASRYLIKQGWHYFFYKWVNGFMKLTLYILAALLATSWVIGFFIFKTGMFIHVLMIIAVLFLMQAIIINPKPNRPVDAKNAY